jgi:hypothetical protein
MFTEPVTDAPLRSYHPPMLRALLLTTLCSTILLGCGSDDEKNQDPAGANELLSRIQAENYRGWARAPGYEQRMQSAAPHGSEVDIYVNPTLSEALAGPAIDSWPEGSTIAKDGWKSDGETLHIVAVMEKRTDGWFWAEYDGAGEPLYSGSPDICTGCHASGADYVRAFGFPQ